MVAAGSAPSMAVSRLSLHPMTTPNGNPLPMVQLHAGQNLFGILKGIKYPGAGETKFVNFEHWVTGADGDPDHRDTDVRRKFGPNLRLEDCAEFGYNLIELAKNAQYYIDKVIFRVTKIFFIINLI